MTVAGAAGAGRARLNPFAFVSDTGLRFALLVVLVACASGRRWFGIAFDVSDVGPQLEACMQGKAILSGALLRPEGFQQIGMRCWFSILHTNVMPYTVAGLALLAGATWSIYRAYPRWKVWRLRLERLDPAEVPDLALALDGLCHAAKLRRKPEFWWNPLDGSNLALAFGTGRRRRVALAGAVALRFHTDPDAFRTVVLHELAHIRNGDVGLAYLTLSIWWAFLATALLPHAFLFLARPQTASDVVLTAAESLTMNSRRGV
jgi:Zn-dependent protease with chaperone function